MNDKRKISELEQMILQKDKQIKTLIENNELMMDSIDDPYTYKAMRRAFKIKSYKDIRNRDSKPIANIILNMAGMDFCDTFDLRENGSCEKFKSCTDCIHDYLSSEYGKVKE